MAKKIQFDLIESTPKAKAVIGGTGGGYGGGYEGASMASRELASWTPIMRSADQDLNPDKQMADARSREMVRNEGYALGAVATHKDNIIGGQYTLNAAPLWKILGTDEKWAEEFQEFIESKFTLAAESASNWLDASRINTLTSMVRLAVGIHTVAGEVVSTAEWIDSPDRPFATAIQMIDPDRLSNPNDAADDELLRRGIERDKYGAPIAAHIRVGHPAEAYNGQINRVWKRVPYRKPWGRIQVIHLYEQMRPDQSRGISDMVAVLKEMKMTKTFRDVTLQQAVMQATYAASIESDLPAEQIWESMGAAPDDAGNPVTGYLNQLAAYAGGSKALKIDGIKIPHLFPGTKLKLQPAGTPGGMGTGFEESLQRHIAAALSLSYEEFSHDYTKTNYSSARASMLNTWKAMQSRKKLIADKYATHIYSLWLEEQINAKEVPLPAGKTAKHFYEGMNKEAYTNCTWIGASRGQIDELKETEAAILRIQNNLSTYEDEIGRSGKDFRTVFAQRGREKKLMEEKGLTVPDPAAVAAAKDKSVKTKKDSSNKGDNADESNP